MSAELEDHITAKYEIRKRLGKGAYGIVWKSVDRRTGEIVALKKIFDAFTNPTDAQRTYREIMFLQAFASHENVIQLLNVIRARNDQDIYLVFEFMDSDLHAVIRAKLLQPVHKQYIMYQLFKVMKYIHSGNCIHRDLKPSNVLINTQCFIKLADFGLARSLRCIPVESDSFNPAMTDYVATRWYRAPEILMGSQRYTTGVDMWSLGCILAEMVAGKPLFPGTSTMNQVDKILSCVPRPNRTDVESLNAPYASSIIDHLMRKRRTSLVDLLPSATEDSVDLLQRLLQLNPDKRITAEDAIKHPYIVRFHQPAEEPVLSAYVIPYLDDNIQLSVENYRDKLYESILQKRAELRQLPVASKAEGDTASPPTTLRSKSDSDMFARPSPHAHPSPLTHSQTPHRSPSQKVPATRQKSAPVHNVVSPEGAAIDSSQNKHSPSPPAKSRPFSSTIHPSHPHLTRSPAEARKPQPHCDLVVTSARIVPSQRPVPKSKRAARGAPSRFAGGTYTQSHGVISRTNLTLLKQNKWL